MIYKYENDTASLLNTNVFGRNVLDLMTDGLNGKINDMPDEAKTKMRRTITKIVNEGKGGVLCILL